jgi:hypothetical protein
MSYTTDLKVLNRIASYSQQFETLYFSPLSRSQLGFPSHSAATYTKPTPKKPTVAKPPTAKLSDSRCLADLNRLAHDLLQFGSVYNVPSRAFFPGHSAQKSPSPSNDADSMKELNRLARLFEMCSSSTLYPSFTPAYDLSHSKCSRRLRSLLHMDSTDSFSTAFPKTQTPKVSFFSGQPRIERHIFNDLLKSKLSETRSVLGLTFTPQGAPALVASWINSLLSKITKPVQKKQKTKVSFNLESKSSEQNDKNTIDPVYVAHPIDMTAKSSRRKFAIFGPADPSFAQNSEPTATTSLAPTSPSVTPQLDFSTVAFSSNEHKRLLSDVIKPYRLLKSLNAFNRIPRFISGPIQVASYTDRIKADYLPLLRTLFLDETIDYVPITFPGSKRQSIQFEFTCFPVHETAVAAPDFMYPYTGVEKHYMKLLDSAIDDLYAAIKSY